MMMIKTAGISAARRAGTSIGTTGGEITTVGMTAEMMVPRIVSFMDIRNFAIIGRDVFSTPIISISIQPKQRSFSMNKPMGPTRSIEKFTMPDRKRTGVGISMDKGADSKVAAGDAAAEGGTKEGAVFRAAAGVAAAGGIRIKGIASKTIIIRGIIIKATTSKTTSSSKGTIMTIIMDKVGVIHLPWDKAKQMGEISKPTKEGIKTPMGTILSNFRK